MGLYASMLYGGLVKTVISNNKQEVQQSNKQFTEDVQARRTAEIKAVEILKESHVSSRCAGTNEDMLFLVTDNLYQLEGKKVAGFEIVSCWPNGGLMYDVIARRDKDEWVCGKHVAWGKDGKVYWANGHYTKTRDEAEEHIQDFIRKVF